MLRIVFMGTPEFAVSTLAEVMGAGHEVAAVYTQPPRPAGRGMEFRKSPVHLLAEAAGIPVSTPKSLRGEAEQAAFRALGADVAVVVAYGLLLLPDAMQRWLITRVLKRTPDIHYDVEHTFWTLGGMKSIFPGATAADAIFNVSHSESRLWMRFRNLLWDRVIIRK